MYVHILSLRAPARPILDKTDITYNQYVINECTIIGNGTQYLGMIAPSG
jgi:hypothetical protein